MRCVICTEPSDELKLQVHRCTSLFFGELDHKGDISVTHAPSEYQHADILTKALVYNIFVGHRNFLMNLND